MRMWSLVGLLLVTTSASAHDQWSNGVPIPEWVKKWCCAEDESPQIIDERRVHRVIGTDPITNVYGIIGYRVEGFRNMIPVERRYDSEDGLTWIFSGTPTAADEFIPEGPMVYCLFTNEGS
jgi:hypothetical protein